MTKKIGRTGDPAEAAGRAVGLLIRWGPGVAGAVLVTVGLAMAWEPLGWIAAGVWFLLLDRRTP